jgi:hypothetical protein
MRAYWHIIRHKENTPTIFRRAKFQVISIASYDISGNWEAVSQRLESWGVVLRPLAAGVGDHLAAKSHLSTL